MGGAGDARCNGWVTTRAPDEEALERVAPLVLTSRLVVNFAAEAAGKSAADVVAEVVAQRGWREA